jgi:hypothetical protein
MHTPLDSFIFSISCFLHLWCSEAGYLLKHICVLGGHLKVGWSDRREAPSSQNAGSWVSIIWPMTHTEVAAAIVCSVSSLVDPVQGQARRRVAFLMFRTMARGWFFFSSNPRPAT